MEYIYGPSLAQMLARKRRLELRDVLRIGLEVAAGLRAGLEQGLIHRDIKPGNVLLASNGQTKIVDLGLARPNAIGPDEVPSESPARGGLVGTPDYLAPEP